MQWTVIGGCLAALLVLCTTNSVSERNVEDGECTQANKQKALYGYPTYSLKLTDNPATKAYTAAKGIQVEPLRKHANNGIYAATMMSTKQKDGTSGCGGYFGVQWKGRSDQKDMLLYSIWDKTSDEKTTSYALPMHGTTCKRNLNDGQAYGSQCKLDLPKKLLEGDELILTVEREGVESAEFKNVTYKGHVWRVTAYFSDKVSFQYGQQEVITIGRILFTDDDLELGEESTGGITGMSLFHEHLGCTPCGSFAFEEKRTGPYITETAGNTQLPELQGMDGYFACTWNTLGNCTCRAFDVKSAEFGSINFLTGAEGLIPHWDVKERVKIY